MATENKGAANNAHKSSNKRKHYRPHNKPVKKGSYPIHPGVQGFFITCDGGREHQASHEAINVIDSFFEELMQGVESSSLQGEMSKEPLNKKVKFVYSDSSEDDEEEDDDDDKDGCARGKIKKTDDKGNPSIDRGSDTNHETSSAEKEGNPKENDKSVDEKTLGNKDEKEQKTNNQENEEAAAGEPPSKKQCLVMVPPKTQSSIAIKADEKSIDRLIEAELAELGDKSKRRFSKLDSGCNGVVFVQMRKKDGDPSPKDIAEFMMTSLASSRKHVSRFMLRVLPIELSCYASEEEIIRAIKPLIALYFPPEAHNSHKFAVLYEARANTGIDRMKIINAVAKSVPPPHTVDLSNPDMNIVVQIVKTICLIGVVEKYKELAKFNIRQLTSSKC